MKAIVSFSGGMDSATVLSEAIHRYNVSDVLAVGFTYGSKHNAYENQAAQNICEYLRIKFELLDFSGLTTQFESSLLKSGGDVPEGHYEHESMSQTVVPGRNIIFASLLAGLAWSKGYGEIWLGVHGGDHFIYPDCRPTFVQYMRSAIEAGTDGNVTLVAPFLHDNKTTIIRRGLELNTPYYLTRTCYKDQAVACGKCGSCQERLEAFKANGIDDPIAYETREIMPKGN